MYILYNVLPGRTYTIVLLSPTYLIQGVLSHPSETVGVVHQYFTVQGNVMPRLIHKGTTLSLQDLKNITIMPDVATDADGDLVPDGLANLSQTALNLNNEQINFKLTNEGSMGDNADLDLDGIKNHMDPDLDGDGLPNAFDSDDDADGLIDPFDQDSDGDFILDSLQTTNDLYYKETLEWISVKFEMSPTESGATKRTITFVTKLREDALPPASIQIRGAPSLLADSQVEFVDELGKSITRVWDRLLLDDGASEDSAANDLLFGRRVILAADKIPVANQVVFVQLVYPVGNSVWSMEFPYTFPPLKPSEIQPQFEKLTRTVSLIGNPFGANSQDFIWNASVYMLDTENDNKLIKIYSSASIPGVNRTTILPENIFEKGSTYKYKVTAQVYDRIPGYAEYTIDSKLLDLTPSFSLTEKEKK